MTTLILQLACGLALIISLFKLVRLFAKKCPDCGSRHNHTVHAGVFTYQACTKCGYPNIKNDIISYNNRALANVSPKLMRSKASA